MPGPNSKTHLKTKCSCLISYLDSAAFSERNIVIRRSDQSFTFFNRPKYDVQLQKPNVLDLDGFGSIQGGGRGDGVIAPCGFSSLRTTDGRTLMLLAPPMLTRILGALIWYCPFGISSSSR